MLVLDRRLGESIVITVPPSDTPTEVRVAYVAQHGLHAKLGFKAGDEVTINRLEVHEQKRRNESTPAPDPARRGGGEAIYPRTLPEFNPVSGMCPWPAGWPLSWCINSEPCDMAIGPCSCGYTHREGEFELRGGSLWRFGKPA